MAHRVGFHEYTLDVYMVLTELHKQLSGIGGLEYWTGILEWPKLL